jgi:hypothetical protein
LSLESKMVIFRKGRPRRKVLYRRLIMKGYERKSIMHESDDIVPEDICGDFEVE